MKVPQTATELGLMDGYPAVPDKRVTHANYLYPPFSRWGFQHMREMMPTAEIYRGDGPVRELAVSPLDLDSLHYEDANGVTRSIIDMLHLTFTDAMVILHDGNLVYERYMNGMNRASQHQMMSVTKSLVGTLALQLVDDGVIDEDRLIRHYVPEVAGSAWEDAKVRHALDMSTGVHYEEVYDFDSGDVARYAIASGLRAAPEGYTGPRTVPEVLPLFKKAGEHGDAFHYVSPNTDIVGWIIARATGKPFSRVFSERIWSKLGAERDAYIIRDSIGMEKTSGGFNATARDMARFGQLILQGGTIDGEEVLARNVVSTILAGGDSDVFARVAVEMSPLFAGWSYRAFWWHTHNDHNAFTGIGIHGQWPYLDPVANVVIIKQSSYPGSSSPEASSLILPALHAIANYLGNQSGSRF